MIDSAFGKSGKVKVFFKDGIYNKIDENLNDDEKNKILVESKVTLIFKKYHK